LDISAALYYHPLFWLFPPFLFLYIHRHAFRLPLKEKVWSVALVTVLILMVGLYVFRLINGSDVVYIDPERGTLFKIFDAIK
jgi:hypothetical protein